MKNTFNLLSYISLFLVFISCEKDESKDPLPNLVAGNYVRVNFTNKILNYDDLTNTYFGGVLTNPGNNISKYTLKVKKRNAGVFSGDYVTVLTVTSFPNEFKISPSDLATALGVSLSDLKKNDFYFFNAEAIATDGTIVTYNDLSFDIRNNSSMKQGFRFVTQMYEQSLYDSNFLSYNNFNLSL